MQKFAFSQVDVFTAQPLKGNPLAVVLGADGLTDEQMAALANWTNLSETAFLLTPTTPSADYRVRIFTPASELPFAGHPTLGSCHAWLAAGGKPNATEIVQECQVGLIRIRRDEDRSGLRRSARHPTRRRTRNPNPNRALFKNPRHRHPRLTMAGQRPRLGRGHAGEPRRRPGP